MDTNEEFAQDFVRLVGEAVDSGKIQAIKDMTPEVIEGLLTEAVRPHLLAYLADLPREDRHLLGFRGRVIQKRMRQIKRERRQCAS